MCNPQLQVSVSPTPKRGASGTQLANKKGRKTLLVNREDHATSNIRRARFAILHALFLPDGGDKLLYPTISPVNSLRVVMSRYFGTAMPLLPDKRFRTNYEKAHLFEEID